MKWMPEAETAVKKVPFFVRRKVRARVEKEAAAAGKKVVSLADVKTTRARFLTNMSAEVKGYQVDACFGPGGCPNRANAGDGVLEKIETLLRDADLLNFLKERVKGDLKFHHEFRVTIADCPNACSQPQIKDVGVIGAALPMVTDESCTLCEACIEACRENAVALENEAPNIDFDTCLACGKCAEVCPTGAIALDRKGHRVMVAGKLGRHPRLARELKGIFSEDEVLAIFRWCIDFYKKNSTRGQRFAELLQDADFEALSKAFSGVNRAGRHRK